MISQKVCYHVWVQLFQTTQCLILAEEPHEGVYGLLGEGDPHLDPERGVQGQEVAH